MDESFKEIKPEIKKYLEENNNNPNLGFNKKFEDYGTINSPRRQKRIKAAGAIKVNEYNHSPITASWVSCNKSQEKSTEQSLEESFKPMQKSPETQISAKKEQVSTESQHMARTVLVDAETQVSPVSNQDNDSEKVKEICKTASRRLKSAKRMIKTEIERQKKENEERIAERTMKKRRKQDEVSLKSKRSNNDKNQNVSLGQGM